jgi:hypothetical protein
MRCDADFLAGPGVYKYETTTVRRRQGLQYGGERKNVIFACSATALGGDRFRLFFGAGDGNVGTAVVAVTPLRGTDAQH